MYQIAKKKKIKNTHTHTEKGTIFYLRSHLFQRDYLTTRHTHTHGGSNHTHTQKGRENDTNSTPPVFLSLSPTLYCLIHSHQKTKTAVIITGDKIKCPDPFHYFLAGPRPSYVTLTFFLLLGVLDFTLQLTRESQKRQKQTNKSPKKHKKCHTMYT